MGKVKPTRVVAKPFKKSFKKFNMKYKMSDEMVSPPQTNNDDDETEEKPILSTFFINHSSSLSDGKKVGGGLSKLLHEGGSGKISKRSRKKMKSVSFSPILASSSVSVKSKLQAKTDGILQAIMKTSSGGGAGQEEVEGQVKLVPSTGILKKFNANATAGSTDPLKSTALKKIVKREFKDKKLRQKVRKEMLKKKLELIKVSEDEAKEAKKRQKTVIIGDMKPMTEVLEELEKALPPAIHQAKIVRAKAAKNQKLKVKPVKKRQQQILEGLNIFHAAGL